MVDLFSHKYPYTDLHELNLDWIISKLIQMDAKLTNFVSLNTIKYADPIQWDITKQYETNTIVIDPATGVAYISAKPVPAGVSISNTDYWSVVFDLQQIINNITDNLTFHNNGASPTLLGDVNTGDWILWNNKLYVALANMIAGTALIEGSNIDPASVEQLTKDYTDTLINALYVYIGLLSDLTTSDKTSIVNAINSLVSDLATAVNTINNTIGSLASLNTVDKTSIVNAINEVLSTVNSAVTAINNTIGSLSDLTTTDKTSVVNAINDVNASCATIVSIIGNLADLTTTDKSSIVNAINDVNASCAIIVSRLNSLEVHDFLKYRRIILQGDSYAVENADGSWAADACTQLNPSANQMYKLATGGAGFIGATGGQTFLQALQAFTPNVYDPNSITDIYIMGGYNDIAWTQAEITAAVQAYLDYCAVTFPIAQVHIGMVGWGTRGDNGTLATVVLPAYIEGAMSRRNGSYITNIEFTNHDLEHINPSPDFIHPDPVNNARIAAQLVNFIKGDGVNFFLNNLTTVVTFEADDANVPASAYGNSWHTNIKNDITEIVCNACNIIWTNGKTIPGNAYAGQFVKIANIGYGCVFGYYESGEFSIMIPINVYASTQSDTTTYAKYDGWLNIASGGIFLGLNNFVGGTTPTDVAVHQLIITPFTYSLPSVKA